MHVSDTDGTTDINYAYDSDGNRVSKADNANAVTTVSLIDPENPTGYNQVMEERPSAVPGTAPTRSYVIGQDVLAQHGGTSQTATRYLLYDGHGSTRALLDVTSGVVVTVTSCDYDAYGNAVGRGELSSRGTCRRSTSSTHSHTQPTRRTAEPTDQQADRR